MLIGADFGHGGPLGTHGDLTARTRRWRSWQGHYAVLWRLESWLRRRWRCLRGSRSTRSGVGCCADHVKAGGCYEGGNRHLSGLCSAQIGADSDEKQARGHRHKAVGGRGAKWHFFMSGLEGGFYSEFWHRNQRNNKERYPRESSLLFSVGLVPVVGPLRNWPVFFLF